METLEQVELHPLLSLIDVNVYPKERVEQLWEHLKTQDYAFDDTTRDDGLAFVASLLNPSNVVFELGDMRGLAMVASIVPRVAAILHFSVWEHISPLVLNAASKSLASYLFDTYQLNRLTAFIPQSNDKAKRMAALLGMKYEGTMKEAFLQHGKYLNVHFYGLLRSEFEPMRKL